MMSPRQTRGSHDDTYRIRVGNEGHAKRRRPTARGKWRRRFVMLALLGAIGAGAAIYWEPLKAQVEEYTGTKAATGLGDILTYTAKKGELRVTVVEEGKLRAVRNSSITLRAQGKITWLAEAGSRVKKGD